MQAVLKSVPIQKSIVTLDQLLMNCARDEGEKKGIVFIQEDGRDVFESYADLVNYARQLLGTLQNRGVQQGSFVIFQIAESQSFVRLFWACILGGLIPVPLTVPITASPNTEAFQKLLKIAKKLPGSYIVTERDLLKKYKSSYDTHKLKYFEYEELHDNRSGDGDCAVLAPDELAYVQYSSGSTGDPKGVALTHENITYNVAQISQRMRIGKEDITGSWMPLTHDMGLVGFHLTPTLNGLTQFIANPSMFMKRPWMYLQKTCQLKATLAASPNFGLEWMIDKVRESQMKDVDLSKIRAFLCGAEPISMETIRRFYNKFSVYGLRERTVFQVYGMAEACVGVTIPSQEHNRSVLINRKTNRLGQTVEYVTDNDPDASELAVVGQPLNGMEICIVDDSNKVLRENQIGHILIKGPNVFCGYIHQAGGFDEQGFFRTGDLGFTCAGELVVAGREKDIIFVNGQNYFAADIELALSSRFPHWPEVAICASRGKAAARDEIIMFVKHRGPREDFLSLARQIRNCIFDLIGIVADYAVPLTNIPKTTSGKVQRYRLREQFDRQVFDDVLEILTQQNAGEYTAPRNLREKQVIEAFEKSLGKEKVSINDNIMDLGASSLKVTMLSNEIEKRTGVRLPIKDLFVLATPKHIAERLEHAETGVFVGIPRAPEAETYPMSSAQKRLFLLNELIGPNIAYNIPCVIQITDQPSLDPKRLQWALDRVLEREEILRTDFHMREGNPVQRIVADARVLLEYSEADTADMMDIQREYDLFVRPFDLSKAPLMRMKMLRVPTAVFLFLDIHHIISDGGSLPIMLHQISELYTGRDVPKPRVRYIDYSAWQKNRDLSGQKRYWLEEFKGEIPVLDLKTDFPRPQEQSFAGANYQMQIADSTCVQIRDRAKEYGTTEFMLMLSVFFALLGKYSRQKEVVVGTPVSGRIHADTEDMLGMFVNTLAIRGEIHQEESFENLLLCIKEKCLRAYDNQEYPFEDLVEALKIKRDFSRNPIFDVMFVLRETSEYAAVGRQDKKGMDKTHSAKGSQDSILANGQLMQMATCSTKFDLTLEVASTEKGYLINFEYCKDLFNRSTIEYMAKHYHTLLDEVLRQPKMSLEDLRMASREEEERILREFNETRKPYTWDKTIMDLFEEQVAKTPDNVAVVFGEEEGTEGTRLTYTQLNAQANSLAWKLQQEYNIQPNDFVAILTERSLEMIVAIYAILKSGAVYVPIDPDYPQKRIRFVLENCKAKLLLRKLKSNAEDEDRRQGREGMCGSQDSLYPCSILQLDLTETDLCSENVKDRKHRKKPTDLAYMIYTSGSTGIPKGTMIEERSAVNLLTHIVREENLNEESVVLQKTSCTFDVSIWELFAPLLCGGRTVLPSPGQEKDPDKIADIIQMHQITDLSFAPSAFKSFLAEVEKNDTRLKSIKKIQLAGESLPAELVKSYTGPGILVNYYGPTEATVYVTKYTCTGQEERIPIGKPISNVKAYILDKHNLCGIGLPGELCIAGDSVARGYLKQELLTAEKFTDNPFGSGRMYCTGDLARWLPDGNIEYLGRMDDQVKIRGFRIELGEIENCLLSIAGIKAAAVVAKEDHTGEKFLCAYIVTLDKKDVQPEEGALENTARIKEELRKTLPDYMIPAYVMPLESIPITPNGKLDREALPLPEYKAREYVVPRNPAEKAVTEAFEKILGVKKVGVTDNFFDLGGDSIKGIRILSILREAGYDSTIARIMRERTPEQIAKNLTLRKDPLPAEQGEVKGEVLLIPVQRYFLAQNLMRPEHFNQSQIYLFYEKVDREALRRALSALTQHHDMLRATLKNNTPKHTPAQESDSCDEIQSMVIRERGEGDTYGFTEIKCAVQEIGEKAEALQAGMNLDTGPLVQAGLFHTVTLGDVSGPDYVLLVIHHLVIDGVSWRILSEDLERAYQQALKGEEIKLPAKTASFQAWSEGLRRYSESAALKRESRYWSGIVNRVPRSRLKEDGPGGEYAPRKIIGRLENTTTEILLRKSAQAYNTEINDLLLTALGRAVYKVTGQRNLAVQMEGHGREEAAGACDPSRTVGWFTSMYPVVLEGLGKSIAEDIRNTKETLRRVPEHGIGYGLLMKQPYDPEKTPDITFNYLGEFGAEKRESPCFTLSEYPRGHDVYPGNQFGTPITINSLVQKGTLTLMTSYDSNRYTPKTLEKLCKEYERELTAVAEHCYTAKKNEPTASDFGETAWTDHEFDKLKNLINRQHA